MKAKSGQTLIEIVLAIGIATMVIAALVVLASASVKTANSSSKRTEANKLATSGLEALRYQRDLLGFSSIANGCYTITSGDVATTSCSTNGGWTNITFTGTLGNENFGRRIEVSDYPNSTPPVRMKRVTVSVRWLELGDASNYKYVNLSTVLSDWASR